MRLGLRARSLLGDCPLLVGLLVLSLMVVRVGMVRVKPRVRASAPYLHNRIGVDWVRGPGGGGKRVRLNRKTPAHLVRKSS